MAVCLTTHNYNHHRHRNHCHHHHHHRLCHHRRHHHHHRHRHRIFKMAVVALDRTNTITAGWEAATEGKTDVFSIIFPINTIIVILIITTHTVIFLIGYPAYSHQSYSHQVGICYNDEGWEYDTVTFPPYT